MEVVQGTDKLKYQFWSRGLRMAVAPELDDLRDSAVVILVSIQNQSDPQISRMSDADLRPDHLSVIIRQYLSNHHRCQQGSAPAHVQHNTSINRMEALKP